MRVLQLIDHMGYGGAPVAVSRITRRLLERGIDVRICAMRRDDITVKVNCSFYVLKGGKYSILRAGLSLRRLCREKDVDIIHAHLSRAVGVATLFSDVPVVAHEHGRIIGRGFWCRLHRRMYRKLHPDHTIACSDVLKKRLQSLGVEKVTTIGNPIDVETWKPNPIERRFIRRAFKFDDNYFVVGYLGRLVNCKNLDSLIECASWLRIRESLLHGGRKFHFFIIGDGNYRNQMERMIERQNMSEMFSFYGQSENPSRLVHSFDCALQVAERGSFGQAVLELMAARIPVVVPPVGAFGEIIKDRFNGFISENTSGRSLADAVLTVANNHCNGILDRAQETAKQFEGEEQVKKIIGIYEEVSNGCK